MRSAIPALLFLATIVNGQAVSTLRACWIKPAASYWCVNADGTSSGTNAAAQPASGYCCTDGSTDPKC
jgi:hypothetical protein